LPKFIYLSQDEERRKRLKEYLYPDEVEFISHVKEFRDFLKGDIEYPLYFIDLKLSEKDGINLALELSLEEEYPFILVGDIPEEMITPVANDIGVYDYINIIESTKERVRQKINFHLKLKRPKKKKEIYSVRFGNGEVSKRIKSLRQEIIDMKLKELEENLSKKNFLRALQISSFLIKLEPSLLRPKGAIREIAFESVKKEELPEQKMMEISKDDIKKVSSHINKACLEKKLDEAIEGLKMSLLIESVSLFVRGVREVLLAWGEYQFKNEVECLNCGTWNDFSASYCKKCGSDLSNSKKLAKLSDEEKLAILTGERDKLFEKRILEKEKSITSILGLFFAFLSCFVLPIYTSIIAIIFAIINFSKGIKRPAIVGMVVAGLMLILNIVGIKTGSQWIERKILLYHQKYSLHVPQFFSSEGVEIEYRVSKQAYVKLWIETAGGKVLKVLVDKKVERGIYKVRWDGRDEKGSPVKYDVFVKMKKGKELYTKVLFYRE